MSSLCDEVETNISEDFGFKGLGLKKILPSYNEKLPFTTLQNLDILNAKSLYAVSYTHLDVYKRQSMNRPSWSPFTV